ncbi:MAG: helix-turn-helix domain-containing protein [Planctomycetota bacterium]
MPHFAFPPHAALAGAIESVWVQEEPEVEPESVEPTVLLPTGRAALVFQYGDPFEAELDDGSWRRIPPLSFEAQRTGSRRVRSVGRTGLVLVNFRPWGAAEFFGPQAELAEELVDARALLSARALACVCEELAHAASAADRRDIVERLLLALPRRRSDPLVRVAAERILGRAGGERVAALAAHFGLSRRQLTRRFVECLGLAPKELMRIARFQHALRRACSGVPWAEVAPTAGYHDQPHLVKECLALSGHTPSALLPGLGEREVGRFYNDTDALLMPYASYL